ncbi:metal-dependent transcriptional regulator [Zongyangia hominis]|uniref:Metal-dependent transcriptional regulator n=1 Tax=Zongyangia hominis TaxID=2763677 RepID=A0A926ECW2_9FIRM|nr:iron dependent repressor, metal binding and dimerization domain protein [Zongyangia hominis]MBC8569904.1 metal-dependent transcriptional regulator [Zongyangia hominis]
MDQNEYRTIKGYKLKNNKEITDAMEDYLEMICRSARLDGYARINHLASTLGVRPSSASKMVSNLKDLGYVDSEKYGIVKPTAKGWELGGYLLYRHDVLHDFLCLLNHTQDEIEQVEQIEHFFDEKTIHNLERLVLSLKAESTTQKNPSGN